MRREYYAASIIMGATAIVAAIFLLLPSLNGVSAEISGTSELDCDGSVSNDGVPYKDGTVCRREAVKCEGVEIKKPPPEPVTSSVRTFVAAVGALLAQGEVGYVTSTCQAGKCVATYGCDGKPLPGLPDVAPTQPLPPNAPTTPITNPDITSPIQPSDVYPVPPNTTSPVPPNDSQVTPLPPNTGVTPLPPNTEATPLPTNGSGGGQQTPSIGQSQTPQSNSGQGGALGTPTGVYGSGGIFSQNTFGSGSFGSGVGLSSNPITNFFTGLFSNLVSSLFGGGSSGGSGSGTSGGTANGPSAPPSSPQQVAQGTGDLNQRAEDALRRFQERQASQEAARRAEEERRQIIEDALKLGAPGPLGGGWSDRSGLPAPGEKTLEEQLLDDMMPSIFPPGAIEEQEELDKITPPPSSDANPGGGVPGGTQVAEIDSGTKADESPPLPPYLDDFPQSVQSGFVQGLEDGLSEGAAFNQARNQYADNVIDGLLRGDLSSGDGEVAQARDMLSSMVAAAKWAHENFVGEVSWLQSQIDKWGPAIAKSDEQLRLDAALTRQNLLAHAEGIAKLRAEAVPGAAPSNVGGGSPALQELAKKYNDLSQRLFEAKQKAGWGGTLARLLPESREPQSIVEIKAMERALAGMEADMAVRAAEDGVGLVYSTVGGGPWTVAANENVGTVTYAYGGVSDWPVVATEPQLIGTNEFSSFPAETVPSTVSVDTLSPDVPLPEQKPAVPETKPAASETAQQPSRSPDTTVPTPSARTPRASAGPASRGVIQNSISFLGALLQSLFGLFTGSTTNDGSGAPQSAQRPDPNPAASITANPAMIDAGKTTTLAWSSVGASKCAVVDATLNVIASGTSGSTSTPPINVSTRFGIICDIEGGNDKFVNEVLVSVRGDTNDIPSLFAQSGPVSASAPVPAGGSASSGAGANAGSSASPAPIDVRTCDPDQSIDSFIQCLCEAEPNPAGCTIPPGGI